MPLREGAQSITETSLISWHWGRARSISLSRQPEVWAEHWECPPNWCSNVFIATMDLSDEAHHLCSFLTHLSCRLLLPLALWHWLCPANMLVVFWYGIPMVLLGFSGPAVWTAKSGFQPLSKKSPYSPGRPWSDSWYQNSSEVTQMLSNVSVTTSHLGSPCHNWM